MVCASRIGVRSQWPTVPQVYINGEFVGGSDILVNMQTVNSIFPSPSTTPMRLGSVWRKKLLHDPFCLPLPSSLFYVYPF